MSRPNPIPEVLTRLANVLRKPAEELSPVEAQSYRDALSPQLYYACHRLDVFAFPLVLTRWDTPHAATQQTQRAAMLLQYGLPNMDVIHGVGYDKQVFQRARANRGRIEEYLSEHVTHVGDNGKIMAQVSKYETEVENILEEVFHEQRTAQAYCGKLVHWLEDDMRCLVVMHHKAAREYLDPHPDEMMRWHHRKDVLWKKVQYIQAGETRADAERICEVWREVSALWAEFPHLPDRFRTAATTENGAQPPPTYDNRLNDNLFGDDIPGYDP